MAPATLATAPGSRYRVHVKYVFLVLLTIVLLSIALWTTSFYRPGPQALKTLDNRFSEIVRTWSAAPGSAAPTHLGKQAPIVCAVEACKLACQHNTGPRMPPIIHMLWKNASIPCRHARSVSSWYRHHLNWTFVLWRDSDLEPFVTRYFPKMLKKFKTVAHNVMKIDLFRYMLMFQYGGVYADIDHDCMASLDKYRRLFPAVITREPEIYSLSSFGFSWPIRALASPAIMMSAPGHRFFRFFLHELNERPPTNNILDFAGPFALTTSVEKYKRHFGVAYSCQEFVYLAPSYSFFPYPDNRLKKMMQKHGAIKHRIEGVLAACNAPQNKKVVQNSPNLTAFCSDMDSMEAITSSAHTIYAVHDIQKGFSNYMTNDLKLLFGKAQDARKLVPTIVYGDEFMRKTVTKENVNR